MRDRLGDWVQTATNIGVILSIILLVVEVRQNNTSTKAQIFQERAFHNANVMLYQAESESLLKLLRSVHDSEDRISAIDALSELELTRLRAFEGANLRAFENNLYQCELEYLDKEFCSQWKKAVRRNMPYWRKLYGGNVPEIHVLINSIEEST